jgi:type IV secretion system protein TrbI
MSMPAAGSSPEEQRIAQEQEAARVSHLFATTNVALTGAASSPPPAAAQPAAAATNAGSSDLTSQDHKLAFLNGHVDRRTTSPDRVQPPASPNVLQAGAVIPASLITGLRSDLPGPVTAQVTEDVYDSPTGKTLLIPQGARLIGQYDAQVSFGQSRALLIWNRLIMPNGKSIVLERQPGADSEGYAGLEDEVDNHWGMLFQAAILSTLLSVGSEAGTGNNENSLVQAIRQGASQSFNQTGEQLVGRSLNIQPTITIRPGFPVRVIVTHDLVLEPYA